jgi:hypothetical protein
LALSRRFILAFLNENILSRLILVVWWSLPNASTFAQTAVLKDHVTPIAEQPSPKSRVIAVLAAGDSVRILKTDGAWMQVAFRGKKKGWMFVGANNTLAPKPKNETRVEEKTGEKQNLTAGVSPADVRPATDGGVSFHLGAFSGQFTYVGKFYYRSIPSLYVEGTFQYVAGEIASFYLLHGNAKYVRPLSRRLDGTLTAGLGVINTVPIRSAGGKSVSNMALNYGLGLQRHLKNNNWLRADLRQYAALRKQGTATFLEFTVGVAIGIRWAKL